MDHGDALRALDVGADAVVVSNHGGRQLDGAPSSIQVCAVCGGGLEMGCTSGDHERGLLAPLCHC
jgi:L-lactate dehydrogenase (cytochrome)